LWLGYIGTTGSRALPVRNSWRVIPDWESEWFPELDSQNPGGGSTRSGGTSLYRRIKHHAESQDFREGHGFKPCRTSRAFRVSRPPGAIAKECSPNVER
jgi:hypothetical protein